MDGDRFDELTRRLATSISRRAALRGAAVALFGAPGARTGAGAAPQVSQAQCGNTSCRNNPGKCNPGCVCCVHGNRNSRCTAPNECSGTPTCPAGTVFDPAGGCVTPATTTTAAPPTTSTAAPTTAAPPTTATPTTAVPTTSTTTAAPATTTTTTTSTTAAPVTTTAAPTTTTTAAPTTTTAAPTTTSTTTSAPGACTAHSDCGDPCANFCNAGTCIPDVPGLGEGSECAPGKVCTDGACQPAPEPCGPTCSGPGCVCPNCQVCDGSGVCQPVICEPGGTCNTRVCNPNSGNKGECVPVPVADDTPCAGGDGVCCDGFCVFGEATCPTAICSGDGDCGAGQSCCGELCIGGDCQCATAADCSALGLVGTRCAPVFCVDGLCVIDPRRMQNFDCDIGLPCKVGLCDGGGTCIPTDLEIGCGGQGFDTDCSFGGCDPETGECRAYPREDRIGQPCEDNRICIADSTCQPDGTCGGGEDTCGVCASCLGNLCVTDATGNGCGTEGVCCGRNCCERPSYCGSDFRCRTDVSCQAKNFPCASNNECCGGVCIPISGTAGICACSAQSSPCSQSSDCCTGTCRFGSAQSSVGLCQ